MNGGFEADAADVTTTVGGLTPSGWTLVDDANDGTAAGCVLLLTEDDAAGGWLPRPMGVAGRVALGLATLESPAGPEPTGDAGDGGGGGLSSYDAFLGVRSGSAEQTLTGLTPGATYRATWRAAAAAGGAPPPAPLADLLVTPPDDVTWLAPTAQVLVDGVAVWSGDTLPTAALAAYTADFVAAGATAVLRLTNATAPVTDSPAPYGRFVSLVVFDDVSVTPLP